MILLRLLIRSLVGPLFSKCLGWIAYGPWGFAHQLSIRIFAKAYKIQLPDGVHFKTLGDFFLRDTEIHLDPSPLLSPVEGFCLEGPNPIDLSGGVSAKGVDYSWNSFAEFDAQKFKNGRFWNLYLAPHNYHWVHLPCDASDVQAYRTSGARLPVNAFGRRLEPKLFLVNERLTFKFHSKDWGEVLLICVAAMGVSNLVSKLGQVPYGQWTRLSNQAARGERVLGFRLGSTVIMLTERSPTSSRFKTVVRVGDGLA